MNESPWNNARDHFCPCAHFTDGASERYSNLPQSTQLAKVQTLAEKNQDADSIWFSDAVRIQSSFCKGGNRLQNCCSVPKYDVRLGRMMCQGIQDSSLRIQVSWLGCISKCCSNKRSTFFKELFFALMSKSFALGFFHSITVLL